MKLHLLGSAGFHPTESRHTACLMFPDEGLVLDAGSSLFRIGPLWKTETLDLFLTHAHLDHVVGLTFLLDFVADRPPSAVRVYGEPEKLEAVAEHLFSPLIFPVPPPFEWRPLERSGDDRLTLASGTTVRWFAVTHPGGALGYRLDWPDKRSFAYVTDTTARDDAPYVEHLRGVDVLVHECYFPDGHDERAKLTGHSCTSDVARVARDVGAGRLILTHINPASTEQDPIGLDDARRLFPNSELARDGMIIEW